MMGALRPPAPRNLTSSTSSLRLQEGLSVGRRSPANHRIAAGGTVINSHRAANKVTGTPCELGQALPLPFAWRAIILPPFNSPGVWRINELGRVPVLKVLVALTFWGQRSLEGADESFGLAPQKNYSGVYARRAFANNLSFTLFVDILTLTPEISAGLQAHGTSFRIYSLEGVGKFPHGNSHGCYYKYCFSVISVLKTKNKTHLSLLKK